MIKSAAHKVFQTLGFDVHKYPLPPPPGPPPYNAAAVDWILRAFTLDTLLDVGANIGLFGRKFRQLGFTGQILSFEPLGSAFATLQANAGDDPSWRLFNYALGEEEATAEIHIAANSVSSSLLPMLPAHEAAAPLSKYVGTETIQIKRLDSVFEDLCGTAKGVLLKIDTQGFEKQVLEGAGRFLSRIDLVHVELSLAPLYEDAPLFTEMYEFLRQKGFELVGVEQGFVDPRTGRMLQLDATFHRPGGSDAA